MKYQLTDEATRDVEEILAYSVKDFGVAQTEHYFKALKECIELLADNPQNRGQITDFSNIRNNCDMTPVFVQISLILETIVI